MVLIGQNNEVFNFDNLVSVRQQGGNIFAVAPGGNNYTIRTYKTPARAAEVMEEFLSTVCTDFAMVGYYAFPTE